MSLQHAVLGFLQYGPRTGYELKRMFDDSVQHFWPAQQSHIYSALSSLLEKELASVELVLQTERPNRKVYSITDKGQQELDRWLAEPAIDDQMRTPFLIQLFFSGSQSDAATLKGLEERAEHLRKKIRSYEQGPIMEPTFSAKLPKREQFFWYLTLDYGIERLRFSLHWIERAIERVRAQAYAQGKDGVFGSPTS